MKNHPSKTGWKPNTGDKVSNGKSIFVCEKWQTMIVLTNQKTGQVFEYTYEQIDEAISKRKIELV